MAAGYHRRMLPHRPTRSSFQLAIVLLLGPALLGALTAWSGDRSPLAALVLWAEPLLLFGALYTLGWLLWDRRPLPALALILGGVAGGAILRVPPVGSSPVAAEPPWAERLRGCTKLPDPVRQPIRVLTWTMDDSTATLADFRERHVDLAILVGLESPRLAEQWADDIRGEALFLPATATSESMALVVRGAFQYCAGKEDSWDIPLPVGEGERGRAVLTFPEIQDAGVVPFVAVQMPQPGAPGSWSGWSSRLVDSAQTIGALSHTLDPRRVVVAGDFHAPRTFRELAAPLLGAGLTEVKVPASWPGPTAGLHALDRVWTGGAWRPLSTWRLSAQGHSRAPLLVDLAPANAQAR